MRARVSGSLVGTTLTAPTIALFVAADIVPCSSSASSFPASASASAATAVSALQSSKVPVAPNTVGSGGNAAEKASVFAKLMRASVVAVF